MESIECTSMRSPRRGSLWSSNRSFDRSAFAKVSEKVVAVSDRFDYVGAESCFESLRVKLERQLIGFVVRFRDLPTPCILSPMPSKATFRESRRSTRVPLKVVIAIEGGAESRTCEGET